MPDALFRSHIHSATYLTIAWTLLALSGCGGANLPADPMRAEPQAAAAKAIQLYDNNGDQKLDQQEMRACPALLDAGPRVDKNRDRTVTAEELAGRLAELCAQSAFLAATTHVNWNGHPLAGAEVVLEPEPFMGEGFPTFRGQTNPDGTVLLASQTDGSNLLPLGFYRARISKTEGGTEIIPPQYNAQTTLGLEVADDAASPNRIMFDLQSN